ncbi:MAG TPA: hypothetical protein VGC41_17185 [Kofleriaceae bacterium]
MRIRAWTAFASNNSGSYVIVGRFPSDALADEVAAELREVVTAHSAWFETKESSSPLTAYAAKLGLGYEPTYDDWPQYSDPPEVWATGLQVFVHADYTVTMPAVLGHAMYARGGRVETEIDHAHHPIVATFEIYFPWRTRETLDIPAKVRTIVDELAVTLAGLCIQPPAWQGAIAGNPTKFLDADLVFGAVFDDLVMGFAAVNTAVVRAGASMRIRIGEALRDRDVDAFAMLRPCRP